MEKSELEMMRAAHKACLDLAAKNAVLAWTWPLVLYSAWVLALNPRRGGGFIFVRSVRKSFASVLVLQIPCLRRVG
jgi:hypothetical protein